jgi:HD-like signal output (HDOD) protein
MNHAELGSLIAEKWNFPDGLVIAIRYHHNPMSAPREYKLLAEAVYLANMFCEYEDGNANFDQFQSAPLDDFNINAKIKIDNLLEQFANDYGLE